MGFTYAGNLGGAGAPVVNKFLANVTLYNGQLVNFSKAGTDALNVGGHVSVAVPAADADDDEFPIGGFVSGIVDGSRTNVAAVSGTAQYGDKTTYTVTQSVIADTGPSEVKVTLAIPGVTLIKAPIYNAAWGTALTVQTNTAASSGGVTITDTGNLITDIIDDKATAYCRTGANRGIYRPVSTTTSTSVNTVAVPFPYAIAVGDTFVIASCLLGHGSMNFPTSADCIDGNHALAAFYSVYYHEINLAESGKEYAVFALWTGQHLHA